MNIRDIKNRHDNIKDKYDDFVKKDEEMMREHYAKAFVKIYFIN